MYEIKCGIRPSNAEVHPDGEEDVLSWTKTMFSPLPLYSSCVVHSTLTHYRTLAFPCTEPGHASSVTRVNHETHAA